MPREWVLTNWIKLNCTKLAIHVDNYPAVGEYKDLISELFRAE